MSGAIIGLNNIPVRTYRWLGVNDTSINNEIPEIRSYNKKALEESTILGCNIINLTQKEESIKIFDKNQDFGVSEKMTTFVKRNFNSGFVIEAEKGQKLKQPIYLNYDMDSENPYVVDNNIISAEENSEVTIIMRYSSQGVSNPFHNGITSLYAKKGSVINLVKVQILEDEGIHLDSISASVEENAEVNYIFIELGAKNSVTSCKTNLLGNKSSGKLRSLYLGDKDRQIDINYVMEHLGKESECLIDTRGVLMDKSSKIFRGTLDFKKGASGSKGAEEENTILLSPGVRNRSVPLLLCSEDNIIGQHAASTGKLSEDKLFYLMSRGFSELEAKKLIVEAAFNPITNLVPNEHIREEISEYIRRRLNV